LALNEGKLPKTYKAFCTLLTENKLLPRKPIETFEGLTNFEVPKVLQGKNRVFKIKDFENLEFYEKVPKIIEFEKYYKL